MTSQIVANINTELKDKAMDMVKSEGITMKALITLLLKGYVNKEIQIGARFNSCERDCGALEIEELSNDENNLLINDKNFEGKRLNQLVSKKCS